MSKNFDFCGWATRFNRKCADGRTIKKGAFKDCDGKTVPLIWNHDHENPFAVLGHALLKCRDDGVYMYGSFNDTESGDAAKTLVEHGDITGVSIYANQLQQDGGNVLHGMIREVSLVLAGANPGAYIEQVMAHSAEEANADVFVTGDAELELYHSEYGIPNDPDTEESKEIVHKEEGAEKMADENKENKKEKTIGDVFDEFTEEQKNVVYALIGQALEDAKNQNEDDNEGDEENMKHNIFESDERQENVLSHSDMQAIFADAKRCGSLREAVSNYLEGGELAHSIDTTGMDTATGVQTYGFNDASMLYPDYKSLNVPPEFIQRNMSWVDKVLASVHRTPFSRIKSIYADITEDAARAKGYIKGNQKKTEVFSTLKRQTDAQLIYKFQKLDREDVIDITDFDVVAWIRNEMRMMLNEEKARAILIGDGRLPDAEDKIDPQHIRPVVTDVPLFNTKVNVTMTAEEYALEGEFARQTIKAVLRARKNYKGSGNPTFWTTEDTLTEMLLLEDQIGHKLYKSEAELATALRVKEIVTVEPMEGMEVDGKPLIGTIVNLADYNTGADKGGEQNMFNDFDIEYNKNRYLIEEKFSGALIKPFSALTILLNVTD